MQQEDDDANIRIPGEYYWRTMKCIIEDSMSSRVSWPALTESREKVYFAACDERDTPLHHLILLSKITGNYIILENVINSD